MLTFVFFFPFIIIPSVARAVPFLHIKLTISGKRTFDCKQKIKQKIRDRKQEKKRITVF